MRLTSLRLLNFRQHADTTLTFDRGLTGIIGPNGSGKSTLLEAIAWALYGNAAARGTRDSIRFARAGARAAVRVELEFELAGHRYRVVRGLTSAECFLDGGDTPIANTITGVSELLQRRLGMTRAEFFHTYFTGQKELDVMATLGPADRARFLSRVLGYDRITNAQELVRERRRALVAEVNGLKQGMPERDAVLRAFNDAGRRKTETQGQVQLAGAARDNAAATLTALTPRWATAQADRDRLQQLQADLRLAQADALALDREIERLEQELVAIDSAHRERAPLLDALVPLPALRLELHAMEGLAAAEVSRQGLLERVRGLIADEARLAERATRLESAPALDEETQGTLATARAALDAIEQTLDGERTAWARDKQEAETRLGALRQQYTELAQQRDTLEGLGEESPCPTCGRPLGASYRGVLDLLSEQVETVRVDGNYYRQRAEQLKRTPDSVGQQDEQKRVVQQEIVAIERKRSRIQEALGELASLSGQRADLSARRTQAEAQLTAVATGYDAAQHAAVRTEVARLAEVATRAARLGGMVERESAARTERVRVAEQRDLVRARVVALEQQRGGMPVDEAAFAALRDAHDAAMRNAQRAELAMVAANGDAERADSELAQAERARIEMERLQALLTSLEADRRLHEELDRALTDLRTDLNFQLRPELAEIASRFLDVLTDGRYNALEFDEDYNLLVLEDGLPKTVISGGEEDLCNLVLRLAISQMIAERAGQAFSLLILDEVFGSLDDTRRGNVMDLLRRLNDRFEQVIVITHIEQVREGLDRVLVVRFDEERGTSIVTSGVGTLAEAPDELTDDAANDAANDAENEAMPV